MLSLESERWQSFRTFFGAADEVPRRIRSWRDSIGGPAEELHWSNLQEQFLHQCTITDAAFAVVPHVVSELDRIPLRKRFDYLVDVGLVEAARGHGSPNLPEDLRDAYHAAVSRALRHAVQCLSLDFPRIEFRYLLSVISNLHGHGVLGDILFNLDCICGECPSCGECVYPEEIQESGYC